MSGSPLSCPFCNHELAHRKQIVAGKPIVYPLPSWYHCDGCGYQEEAPALSRRDLKKIIVDYFRGKNVVDDE